MLGHALLHASDLSNPTLDFDLAEQWRVLLMAGGDLFKIGFIGVLYIFSVWREIYTFLRTILTYGTLHLVGH